MPPDDHSYVKSLRGKPFLSAAAVLTATALAMTRLPLVDDLGFEFAGLTAFIATFVTGFLAIYLLDAWRPTRERRSKGEPRPDQERGSDPDRQADTGQRYEEERHTRLASLLAVLFGLSLSTLFLPLAVMFLKSWISGFCNVPEGLAFYLLLPVITVLWSTAVATICTLATNRKLHAALLFLAVILVTIGISVYRLATEPPVFAYNPIIGYFPGPIYDEVVVITSTLLAARAIVLVSVLAMIAGLVACFDPAAWKLRPSKFLELRGHRPGEQENKARIPSRFPLRLGIRALFLVSLAVLATAYAYRAQLGIVIDREHIRQTLGGHWQTTHFDIYYDLSAATAQRIELISREHEYQLDRITTYLEVPPPSSRIASYIYADADQKKRLMGARHTSMERPGSDEMHLNDAPFPHPVLRHELVHVVSAAFGNDLYGGSYWMGFHEGLAVAVDWPAAPMNPHEWSRAMRVLGLAPPLENLLGTTGFWSAASSRSYTLCGSFVRFLIERYGLENFKQAFPAGAVEESFGRGPAELVAEWEAYVDGIQLEDGQLRAARQRFIRPAIFSRHCPHEVAALNDRAWQAFSGRRYTEAIRGFDRVLALEPENGSALRGLLYSTYRQGDYERTVTVASELIDRPDQVVGLLADAHLVSGDTAWKTGRLDDARTSYRTVVDLNASAEMTRAAAIRLDVLDRDVLRDTVMAYLTADGNRWNRVFSVRDAVDLSPNYAAGYYLVGRWLFLTDSYEQALPYLSKAESLGLPDDRLRHENLRLAALCHFYLKDYDRAVEVFERKAALAATAAPGGGAGSVRLSEAWIERCRWFQSESAETNGTAGTSEEAEAMERQGREPG